MSKPFPMPTQYFAIVLGLCATSIAWFHATELFPFAETVGSILGTIAIAIWLLFISLYAYKIIRYPELVKEELNCPVRFSYVALIPITTMLIGDLFYHWQLAFGEVLVWLGVVAQVSYATVQLGGLWQNEKFTQNATVPPFYLPSVAANFTSATSLALLGYTDIAYFFLGAGLIAWVMFEPVLLQHLRKATIDPAIRSSLGIVLAPSFVGGAAYLTINGGEIDLFIKFLWGYGFLQLLFLARIFPWICQKQFSIGLWAFSFGLGSMANTAVSFAHHSKLHPFAIGVFAFANLMILLLCLGTLLKIVQGKFWLK